MNWHWSNRMCRNFSIFPSEGEVVLDILEAGEDYRVLVGMPDGNPEHIYLPTDELGRGNDYIYYRCC